MNKKNNYSYVFDNETDFIHEIPTQKYNSIIQEYNGGDKTFEDSEMMKFVIRSYKKVFKCDNAIQIQ